MGFTAGRYTGRYHAAAKVAQTYNDIPEPLKEQIRSMSKEDIDRMMRVIREYSQNAVVELSLNDLFEVMTVMRIEALDRKGGAPAVAEYSTQAKKRFISGYRDGSSKF